MPADTNPATARQKLQDCTTYPNALNLSTMLAALPKAQFAIPEVNLEASNPGVFTDLERMVDLMISKGIVPIIITYTYRTDAAFNLLVDHYNTALVAYAQTQEAAADRLEQGDARAAAVLAVAGTVPLRRRPLHARHDDRIRRRATRTPTAAIRRRTRRAWR